MDRSRLSNLLFLSGLCGAALPGCDADDDGSTTAATTMSTAAGTETGSESMSSTGGEGGETTAGGSTSSSNPTATTGANPTTAGGEGVCGPFATKSVECGADEDYDTALQFCNELFDAIEMNYSAECAVAYEELLACASGVDCEAFNNQDEPPAACTAAADAVQEACDFETGGSTSTGPSGDTVGPGGSTGG